MVRDRHARCHRTAVSRPRLDGSRNAMTHLAAGVSLLTNTTEDGLQRRGAGDRAAGRRTDPSRGPGDSTSADRRGRWPRPLGAGHRRLGAGFRRAKCCCTCCSTRCDRRGPVPRCAEVSCGRWRPERLAPQWAAGIRLNGDWYCSRPCVADRRPGRTDMQAAPASRRGRHCGRCGSGRSCCVI